MSVMPPTAGSPRHRHRPTRWHTGRVPLFEANGMVHDVGAKACVGTAIAFAAARDAALSALPRLGVVDAQQRATLVDAKCAADPQVALFFTHERDRAKHRAVVSRQHDLRRDCIRSLTADRRHVRQCCGRGPGGLRLERRSRRGVVPKRPGPLRLRPVAAHAARIRGEKADRAVFPAAFRRQHEELLQGQRGPRQFDQQTWRNHDAMRADGDGSGGPAIVAIVDGGARQLALNAQLPRRGSRAEERRSCKQDDRPRSQREKRSRSIERRYERSIHERYFTNWVGSVSAGHAAQLSNRSLP